jgi:hypothetical protein
MDDKTLEKYSRVFAEALTKNMPDGVNYVLLLFPKAEPGQDTCNAALISSLPEVVAMMAMSEMMAARAARALTDMGASPEYLHQLRDNARESVRKVIEKDMP